MVNLKINGRDVSVKEGTTILDAAKSIGETIPTLCYLKDINEIGACRVCVVEVEGTERCVTACNNFVAVINLRLFFVLSTKMETTVSIREMDVLLLPRHILFFRQSSERSWHLWYGSRNDCPVHNKQRSVYK